MARSPKQPTHRTPRSSDRSGVWSPSGGQALQPMFDVPTPRPHAGKKSTRTHARPWELKA